MSAVSAVSGMPDGQPQRLVACVQRGSSEDPAENIRALRKLEVPEADLVLLPEYYHREPGQPDTPLGSDAETLEGEFVTALVACAAEHGGVWVAGMVERSEDPERPYNTLVAVDGDGVRAAYRKIHLYDSFGFRESDRLRAGPMSPVVLDLDGVSVGLMTCYDLRFPELSRELVRRGADLLLVPAAWVAGPRKVDHWRTLLRARAIENICYVAAAAQTAPRYTGHSMIIDPRGDVLTEVGEQSETVVTALVGLAEVREARTENPSLANRRDQEPWE